METDTEVVKKIWDRIHHWMNKNSPEMLKLLRPGVSKKQIKELKEKLEIRYIHLPEDFVASYLIHNGSTAKYFFGSIYANSFYSICEIFDSWFDNKLDSIESTEAYFERTPMEHDEVQNKYWSNRWIPFGRESANLLCIDLEPTKVGDYGQVIQWHANEDYTALRASSFAEYLNNFANDMENGRYSLSVDGTSLICTECVDLPWDGDYK